MTIIKSLTNWFKKTDKKKVIEIVSASMSIPVLTTVFLINISNLKKTGDGDTLISPTPKIETIIIKDESNSVNVATATPTKFVCKKEIGLVEIVSPQDNQLIIQDPVNIDISYNKNEYCPLVWSYKLDNNQWSAYTDKVISLYNLPSGEKKLEVKVKSVSAEREIVLLKKFTYVNPKTTPSVVSTSTMSATPKVEN